MALEDLNDKLHSRGFHENPKAFSPYDPRVSKSTETAHPEFTQTEKWQTPLPPVAPIKKPGFFSRLDHRKKLFVIWGGVVLFLVLLGLALFVMRGKFFNEENIRVGIQGPESVQSAESTSYTFTYANDNWSALEDAVLVLSYPETFILEPAEGAVINRTRAEIALGSVGARSEGTWEFAGTFAGFQGDLAYLNVTLRYTPSGLTSSFTKETQLPVQVTASPLNLEISAPQEMSSGQEIAYVVDYRNDGKESYSDVRLQLEYPAGFRFLSGDPRSSEGENVWYLGTLSPGQGGKVTVRGILSGEQDENKKVRALLGRFGSDGNFLVQNTRERQTRIHASPLVISQNVNGLTNVTVNAGDVLSYQVTFRNNGTIGLRDAIVTVEIDSPYLDYSRLSLPTGGAYNESQKMIVWRASDAPSLSELEPGEEGNVRFTIPVLRTFTLANNDKNIFIRSVAKIDSVDLPTPIGQNKIIGSNTLLVKLNSLVTPTLNVYYHDQTFSNTGPLPPVAGKETTYTLRLRLASTPNDISGARLVLNLPAGVDYKNKFLPTSEIVRFNERAGELTWDLGTLAPGRERELIFQVGVTPGPNDVGKGVVLVNAGTFSGLDTYTKEEVKVSIDRRENYMPEDTAAAGVSNIVRANE